MVPLMNSRILFREVHLGHTPRHEQQPIGNLRVIV